MRHPVVVSEHRNRLEADITAGLLEGFGVECAVVADDLGGMGPGQSFVRGVQVVVDESDAERAREILKGEE